MMRDELTAFSDRQFEEAYRKILKKTIKGFEPTTNPTALILGGQPGVGKTTLQARALSQNPNQIVINGDEYRSSHPNFDSIERSFGDESVLHTQAFSNAIVERLITELSDKRYNLIIEGTLRTTEVPIRTCRLLQGKGYTVELAVMAVSKEQSWQGTIDRYNAMKAKGESARATPKGTHDYVVSVLPDNIDALYNSNIFDRITLYTRSGECIYDSIKQDISPKQILSDRLHDTEMKIPLQGRFAKAKHEARRRNEIKEKSGKEKNTEIE